MKQPVKWMNSTECDFCHKKESPAWYDTKTTYGPWALTCEDCYSKYGIGKLGQGLGQKYDGKTLLKLEG